MRCIVTGGNGFIGHHVANELVIRGFDTGSYDIALNKARTPNCSTLIQGDILDLARVKATFKSIDAVFHLAGVLGTAELFMDPHNAIEANIVGSLNVILGCLAQRPPPRIFLPAKPNEWDNIYSVTSQAVEKLGHSFRKHRGLDVRVLRFWNVYGPGQSLGPVRKAVPHFITSALTGKPIEIFGDGKQIVELVFVKDVARAIVDYVLLDRPVEQTYQFVGSHRITVDTLVAFTKNLTNSVSPTVYLPARDGEESYDNFIASRDLTELVGNVQERALLNGLQETIDWYDRNPEFWSP